MVSSRGKLRLVPNPFRCSTEASDRNDALCPSLARDNTKLLISSSTNRLVLEAGNAVAT